MFYSIVKRLAHIVIVLLFKMEFTGLENIPEDEGFIIASNHRSYMDPVFLVPKVKKPVKFMAKQELFKNKVFGYIISKLGAFPVARGSGEAEPLKTAIDYLQAGSPLVMFPEGTRSKTGKPKRARSGVSLIAGQAGVGILPVSIDYGKKLSFRTKVTIRFHPLMTAQQLGIDTNSPATLRKASRMVMDEIVSGLTRLPEIEEETV